MRIAEQRGGWLHEVRPDVIPQGWLTNEELSLWVAYYERRSMENKKRG